MEHQDNEDYIDTFEYSELKIRVDSYYESLTDEQKHKMLVENFIEFDAYVLSKINEGDIVKINFDKNTYEIINHRNLIMPEFFNVQKRILSELISIAVDSNDSIIENIEFKELISTINETMPEILKQQTKPRYPRIFITMDEETNNNNNMIPAEKPNNQETYKQPENKATLIVAVTNNHVIGIGDKLPWNKLKDDMLNFKNETTDNIVIMGFNTWKGFDFRPLPNRINIIITSRKICSDLYYIGKHNYGQTYFANSIEDAFKICKIPSVAYRQDLNSDFIARELFVIGGAKIYKQFLDLNLVDRMVISNVDLIVEDTEHDNLVFLSPIDISNFSEVKTTIFLKDISDIQRNEYDFKIREYLCIGGDGYKIKL